MRSPARALVVPVAVAALVLPGCSAGERDEPASEDGSASEAVTEVEIAIEGGEVTPQGERYDVTLGEPIRLIVDSDMPDELHLHGTPVQTFDVEAGEDQVFELTLEQPGVAELESHELGVLVASFAARP
jgi:hypothetical protein